MSFDVDLLTQAIDAVREETDQRDDPEYHFDYYRQEFRESAFPKTLSHRVARQVMLLSGLKPHGKSTKNRVHVQSVEERAAELLGLDDAEILFGEENALRDIERYRDQMEDGDAPYGTAEEVLA